MRRGERGGQGAERLRLVGDRAGLGRRGRLARARGLRSGVMASWMRSTVVRAATRRARRRAWRGRAAQPLGPPAPPPGAEDGDRVQQRGDVGQLAPRLPWPLGERAGSGRGATADRASQTARKGAASGEHRASATCRIARRSAGCGARARAGRRRPGRPAVEAAREPASRTTAPGHDDDAVPGQLGAPAEVEGGPVLEEGAVEAADVVATPSGARACRRCRPRARPRGRRTAPGRPRRPRARRGGGPCG